MATRILAALTLTGAFDPAEITRQIGIEPTQTARRGDSIQKTKIRHKTDVWSLSTGKQESLDLDALVRMILDQIGERAPAVAAIRAALSLDAEIACAVYVEGQTPAISLDRETVARIAALGASIDVDLYILDDD